MFKALVCSVPIAGSQGPPYEPLTDTGINADGVVKQTLPEIAVSSPVLMALVKVLETIAFGAVATRVGATACADAGDAPHNSAANVVTVANVRRVRVILVSMVGC